MLARRATKQVKLFDAAVKDLRQNYARRSIEMIEVFARAKKKVTERSRAPEGEHKGLRRGQGGQRVGQHHTPRTRRKRSFCRPVARGREGHREEVLARAHPLKKLKRFSIE